MKYLNLTFPTPAENLACDEALLDACEATRGLEVLRFWEPHEHFIVLGYANKAAVEANLAACESYGIPVLRRTSGGGAVLQGPGCLNYSLVLQLESRPGLHSVVSTTEFVLERNAAAIAAMLGQKVEVCGTSDLACDGMKFSGSAQRRKRRGVLFHGTFLFGLDLALLGEVLAHPSHEPDYRRRRLHTEFVRNLNGDANLLKRALRGVWQAHEELNNVPQDAIAALVRERYSRREWNFKY
ncbi:MAG: lipoate--protein ligase family protein [Verrucomicrobia bacterium]|nr:lipoate--protein ligase family protein [Verrucomicrobiota bacterium]